MPAWLKAGLIGAAILVVLDLIGIIPLAACVTYPLMLLTYAGVGALAAAWHPLGGETGPGAGQGALAALLAAVIGGLVNLAIITLRAATLTTTQVLSQLPPGSIEQLRQAGIDPSIFAGPRIGLLTGSLCCGVGLLFAAALGAIGGAIYAALRPQTPGAV